MPIPLREISLDMLTGRIRTSPGRYGLLLGAGCSAGAGVPTASGVVTEVAKRLGRNPDNWRPSYADALRELGPTASQQDFLSGCIQGKQPTRLHYDLASLVESGWFTALFTTNFDSLVEDAVARTQRARRCLIINDEGIARAIAAQGALSLQAARSYVVKLHGDYLFGTSRNQPWEVASLTTGYREIFQTWLQNHGLLMVGYGSGDASVRRHIEDAAAGAGLPYGLIWVARGSQPVPDWLTTIHEMRQGGWVEILRIEGAEQLFARLRQCLTPTSPDEPDSLGLEDNYEYSGPYLEALADLAKRTRRQAVSVSLREIQNFLDSLTSGKIGVAANEIGDCAIKLQQLVMSRGITPADAGDVTTQLGLSLARLMAAREGPAIDILGYAFEKAIRTDWRQRRNGFTQDEVERDLGLESGSAYQLLDELRQRELITCTNWRGGTLWTAIRRRSADEYLRSVPDPLRNVLRLLVDSAFTVDTLVDKTGLSRGRVSKLLRAWEIQGLVRADDQAFRVTDAAAVSLRQYPLWWS